MLSLPLPLPLPLSSILPISLYTFSVVIASLLFYFSYQILQLFRLPLEKYTKPLLREEHAKVIHYETIHMGLVLVYLGGLVGCLVLSLESEKGLRLTISELGASLLMVLYPIVDMKRIIGKKKAQLENAWPRKLREIFEESMKYVESRFSNSEERRDWRECFSEFPHFPVDQLEESIKEFEGGKKDMMAHAWMKEKENLVNEYKQFYHSASYTPEKEKK